MDGRCERTACIRVTSSTHGAPPVAGGQAMRVTAANNSSHTLGALPVYAARSQ